MVERTLNPCGILWFTYVSSTTSFPASTLTLSSSLGTLYHWEAMDEQDLRAIERAKGGEAVAFGELYDRYVERVYRFLYGKTFHRETAEDLTSQTFLKALEHLARYDPARGELASWLYRIAQNTFLDHYRRGRPTVDMDALWDLGSGEDVAESAARAEALGQVQAYLDRLNASARELILLRVWHGLSYREISQLTGRSEGSLKMACSRAMRELRATVPLGALLTFLLNRFHL